jgi:hypothetical protein
MDCRGYLWGIQGPTRPATAIRPDVSSDAGRCLSPLNGADQNLGPLIILSWADGSPSVDFTPLLGRSLVIGCLPQSGGGRPRNARSAASLMNRSINMALEPRTRVGNRNTPLYWIAGIALATAVLVAMFWPKDTAEERVGLLSTPSAAVVEQQAVPGPGEARPPSGKVTLPTDTD